MQNKAIKIIEKIILFALFCLTASTVAVTMQNKAIKIIEKIIFFFCMITAPVTFIMLNKAMKIIEKIIFFALFCMITAKQSGQDN